MDNYIKHISALKPFLSHQSQSGDQSQLISTLFYDSLGKAHIRKHGESPL